MFGLQANSVSCWAVTGPSECILLFFHFMFSLLQTSYTIYTNSLYTYIINLGSGTVCQNAPVSARYVPISKPEKTTGMKLVGLVNLPPATRGPNNV